MARHAVDNCKYPGRGFVCGKCLPCRVRKRGALTARAVMEAQFYPDDRTQFVTVGYNEDFLPTVPVECRYTGEKHLEMTLRKSDAQAFKRRVVDYAMRMYSVKVRYLGAGEYGTEGGRPHYHFLIYGLTQEQAGEVCYRAWSVPKTKALVSEHCSTVRFAVSDLTKRGYHFEDRPVKAAESRHQMGFITIGEGNAASAAYTASYTLSGLTDESKRPEGVEKEFALWSTRPAIGARYMSEYGRGLAARFQVAGLPSTYGPNKPTVPLPQKIELLTPKGMRPFPLDRTMREHLLRGMGIDPDSDEAKEARLYAFETREEAMFLPGDPLGLLEEANRMARESGVRAGRTKRRMANQRRTNPH